MKDNSRISSLYQIVDKQTGKVIYVGITDKQTQDKSQTQARFNEHIRHTLSLLKQEGSDFLHTYLAGVSVYRAQEKGLTKKQITPDFIDTLFESQELQCGYMTRE
jgi:hypothetical protein